MVTYILRRLGQAVVALWGTVTIVFLALRLTGSPAALLAGPTATAIEIARISAQLGLNHPLWDQYVSFLGQAIHGNLGYSYVQGEPALTLVLDRFPYTVELAAGALFVGLLGGIIIGALSGVFEGTWVEWVSMPIIVIGQSVPVFWTGLVLILLFAVHSHVFPSSGDEAGLLSLVLPAITLGLGPLAAIARMTRNSVLEQVSCEYTLAAFARGATRWRVLWHHVARNAVTPVMTLTGLQVATLLGGAVITEEIFAWPGMGLLTINSVAARDFPVIQAIVILSSTVFILANLAVDLAQIFIDPRIRREAARA